MQEASGLLSSVPRRLAWAWIALLALLALTLGLAFVPLGSGNTVVALAIGAAKALIVLFVFMEIAKAPPLVWLFASVGLFWLMILYGLSAVEYATRSGFPQQP